MNYWRYVQTQSHKKNKNDDNAPKNNNNTVDNLCIKVIRGRLQVTGKGTISWKIKYDQGVQHDIIIPNTLNVKHLPYCLLSPKHWGQESIDHSTNKNGTICTTTANEIILWWNQRLHELIIPIDQSIH